MSFNDPNESGGRSISLPAMLALLLGAGALFVLNKFDFLFGDLSPTVAHSLAGGAIAFLLWGTIRSFSDLPRRHRGVGSASDGTASRCRGRDSFIS